jgi:hypothetical protein
MSTTNTQYKLSFIKYFQSRKQQWTLKELTRALNDLGYEPIPVEGARMIVYIVLKESTIQERRRITDRLNLVSRNFPYRWERLDN